MRNEQPNADGITTCSGTPTGAQLTYDNEGRLSHWQNAPSSPTTTDDFLYDGAGNRVEQLATISGSPVTTVYVAHGPILAPTPPSPPEPD